MKPLDFNRFRSSLRNETPLWAAALLMMMVLSYLTPQLWTPFSSQTNAEPLFFYKFGDSSLDFSSQSVSSSGLSQDVDGALRLSNTDGSRLEIPVSPFSGGVTTFHMSGWSEGDALLDVSLELVDSGSVISLARQGILKHRDFELTPFLKPHQSARVVIKPVYSDGSNSRIEELSMMVSPKLSQFPGVDVCLSAFLFLILLYLVFRNYFLAYRFRGFFLGAVPILLFLGIKFDFQLLNSSWVWLLGSLILLVIDGVRGGTMWKQTSVGFLLVVSGALAVRWPRLAATMGQNLEGDAITYFRTVANFDWSHPLNTGIREPMYIWVQALVADLFGSSPLLFRLVTVLLSSLNVGWLYLLIQKLSRSRLAALAGVFLFIFGQFFVLNSVRGERSELFLFFLLGTAVFLVKPGFSIKTELLAAFFGAAMCLTWMMVVPGVLTAYVYRWILVRVRAPLAALFFVLFAILLTPHLFYEYKTNGDPFRPVNMAVNYYETARDSGRPVFSGPKKTWGTYLLEKGGLMSLAQKTAVAYAQIFLNPNNPFNKIMLGFHYTQNGSYFFYPFLIAGILASLWRRVFWIYVLLFSFLHISISFYGEVRDPRIFLHLAPFFCFFLGMGVRQAFFLMSAWSLDLKKKFLNLDSI